MSRPSVPKQLFSMVVGPLPGVSVPAGGRDPSDYCGTPAVGYIHQVWDSLTPEQRKAATQLIHPAGNAPAARMSTASLLPQLIPTGFLKVANQPAYDYQTLAQNANTTLAHALGDIPRIRGIVPVDYDPPPGTEYAHTWSYFANDSPNPNGCESTSTTRSFSRSARLTPRPLLRTRCSTVISNGRRGRVRR